MAAGALHVLVMAKEPVPGRVKTRLCPPLEPHQAAQLAEAALADTLEAVAMCGADERILALDGRPGDWLPPGFKVIPQLGEGLAQRLAAAWAHVGGPGLQVGMDTPQVSGCLLDDCLAELLSRRADAILGAALDGGWWAIGLRRPDERAFEGIPMSCPETWRAQRRRLTELGYRVSDLPVMRDFDHFDDAHAVAAEAPHTRFASALATIDQVRAKSADL